MDLLLERCFLCWNPECGYANIVYISQDVVIRMDQIIGGQERCGFGWNMLMDCLSEGRAVSLPASAVGGAKMSLNGAGGDLHS